MILVRNRWYVAAWAGEILERQRQSIAINWDMSLHVLSVDAGGAHSRRIIEKGMQAYV